MKRILQSIVHVPGHYWAWALAMLSLGLGWGHSIAFYPPVSYDGVLHLADILRLGATTAAGGLLASVCLFISRSSVNRRRLIALWLELVGVILLAGGPLQYCAIQVGFLIDGQFADRYALAWFAWSMLTFVLVRVSILIPILRRERKAAKGKRVG